MPELVIQLSLLQLCGEQPISQDASDAFSLTQLENSHYVYRRKYRDGEVNHTLVTLSLPVHI